MEEEVDEYTYEEIEEERKKNRQKRKGKDRVAFSTVAIKVSRKDKALANEMLKYLGFDNKTEFLRYILLTFIREQEEIRQAKIRTDLKFIEDYEQLRRKWLMKKNNVKEKIRKLKDMGPSQDAGGKPFTAEDLME